MTSFDLLLMIATLSLIATTSFLCIALYWFIRTLRIWERMSAEAERSVSGCVERFSQALHAVTSLKAVGDIALQTLQAAMTVYQKRARVRRTPKSKTHDES